MTNIIAYLTLVSIWSTTPLTVKWSASELTFAGAIFWRILLSAILALLILRVRGEKLFSHPQAWHFYVAAALGIAPNFLLVYWASLYIPSGLISVIFSLTPFLIGFLSWLWLGKQVFTTTRFFALVLAFVGLLLVFADQWLSVGGQAVAGILAMLLSVTLFSVSSVWLQKMSINIPALHKTAGGLCFSVPPLAVVWFLVDGQLPWPVSYQAGLSVIYLGVFGSLLGFALYYFLLHHLSAYVVSTVGMASPVFALLLGYWIEQEPLSIKIIGGALLVIIGLSLYHMRSFVPIKRR